MKIINIFLKWEYFVGLCFIILNIIIMYILYIIKFPNIEFFSYWFYINFLLILFYYFLCIFIESKFNNNSLRLLQFRLQEKIFTLSSIINAPIVLNFLLGFTFSMLYMVYMHFCPFSMQDIDYSLHLRKRCELYDDNHKYNNSYKFICSYNPAQSNSYFEYLLTKYFSIWRFNCSRIESLTNSNEIIDRFVKEYYKEDLYFCEISKYSIVIYSNSCDSKIISLDIVIPLLPIFTWLFLRMNFLYFRNIEVPDEDYIIENEENRQKID